VEYPPDRWHRAGSSPLLGSFCLGYASLRGGAGATSRSPRSFHHGPRAVATLGARGGVLLLAVVRQRRWGWRQMPHVEAGRLWRSSRDSSAAMLAGGMTTGAFRCADCACGRYMDAAGAGAVSEPLAGSRSVVFSMVRRRAVPARHARLTCACSPDCRAWQHMGNPERGAAFGGAGVYAGAGSTSGATNLHEGRAVS
jgi:hypothetical protein